MTAMILGAGGLLGHAMAAQLADTRVVTAGRSLLQGASERDLARLVKAAAPEWIINCAADTDAEQAELDDAAAIAANVDLPATLARLCAERGIMMVHFSSTGCYGDWKDEPYVESDPLRPTTRHHHSKAAGERAIGDSGCDHLIARTGWLFGGAPEQPRNFVWRRLEEACVTSDIVADGHQKGCPTWVADVARQIVKARNAGIRGVVNLVAHGSATRADYVARIVAAAQLPCQVQRGPAFRRRAPVSANETAINSRLAEHGVDIMPPWEEGVDAYVQELKRSLAWALLRKGVTP